MGSSIAARLAGHTPNTTPTAAENMNAMITADEEICVFHWKLRLNM